MNSTDLQFYLASRGIKLSARTIEGVFLPNGHLRCSDKVEFATIRKIARGLGVAIEELYEEGEE